MKDYIDLIARIMLSLIFMFEAYDSLVYFKKTKETMAAYGITWQQDILLISVIVFLIVGATLVTLGYFSSVGVVMLLMYVIPVTFIVYSFWNDPPESRHIQSIMFMKNIAIIGGLLLLLVNGAGKYSVHRFIHVLRLPK